MTIVCEGERVDDSIEVYCYCHNGHDRHRHNGSGKLGFEGG